MDAFAVRRSGFVGFAFFLAFITGIVAARPNLGSIQFFLSWLVAFSLVLACLADARIVGKSVPPGVQFIMLITWPIAVPFCLIWARGWRGIGWLLLIAVTLWLTYYVTAVLFYYFARTNAA